MLKLMQKELRIIEWASNPTRPHYFRSIRESFNRVFVFLYVCFNMDVSSGPNEALLKTGHPFLRCRNQKPRYTPTKAIVITNRI